MRETTNPIAVDTENTGLRPYQGDKNIMASFADDRGAWAEPPDQAGETIREAVSQGRTLIMHNGVYDRQVLEANWGIVVPDDQYWDTQGVDWLLDENADHRLKEGIGARLFGVNAKAEKDELKASMRGISKADAYKYLRDVQKERGITRGHPEYLNADETHAISDPIAEESKRTWSDMTYDELEPYAAQDASLTWRIFHWQQNALEEDTFVLPYLDRVHDIASLCHRINSVGICVNQEHAEQGFEEALEKQAELQAPFGDVNLRSSKQLAELLFDDWGLPVQGFTAGGQRATNKAALSGLAYDPRVQGLLEFKQIAKQIDGYYAPLLDRTSPDGRIHPSLTNMRTVTGRFSCSGPNLQTIPRESTAEEIRKVFRSAPGLVLSEWDLSQIEVRIAAEMSNEAALLEVYADGGDVYQSLADSVGCSRTVAKVLILMTQYGAGPKKIAQTLALGTGTAPDVKAARALFDQYWRTYPNLDRLFNGLQNVAKRKGYLPMWKPGRRRRFRSPHNPHPRWYTALNASIQGGAALLMQDVLWEIEPLVRQEGWGQVVLTVHDSVILEHEPGVEDKVTAALEEITKDVTPYKIDTPWGHKAWEVA